MKHRIFILGAIFIYTNIVFAEVRLPCLVSNNMILQRDMPAKIWGTAAPGENIAVYLEKTPTATSPSTGVEKFKTVADKDGHWELTIPAHQAGGNYNMQIKGNNVCYINNIIFGDVWLCSGQSNMETPVSRLMSKYGDEINAYTNPDIRYVKIPMSYNFHEPQTDVLPCAWVMLDPQTAQNFSGVAYFFAKFLYEKTQVPQGIINSSVGGTPAEAWISETYIKRFPAAENALRMMKDNNFVEQMQSLNGLAAKRWGQIADSQDLGINEHIRWYSPNYDDSQWAETHLFDNSWGKNGYAAKNGIFWFRKEIDIPQTLENLEAKLFMGRIVDADSLFVNGIYVGSTSYQYPPRNYTVAKNILKHGKNIITVRLVSQSGTPEFVKEKPYKIVFGNGQEISLEGAWKYKVGAVMPAVAGNTMTIHYQPTGLYNAMIAPLRNFNIKGFVWYQGEANTFNYYEYFDLMNAMIANWREDWRRPQLPFLFVQLCNFMEPAHYQQNSAWAALRNVQRLIDEKIDNTAMAVTIDIGEWNDIHPLNKKDVAVRLGLQAQKHAYSQEVNADAPRYKSYEIKGNKIILHFKDGTDKFAQADDLQGFYITDRKGDNFVAAKAKIVGKTVEVWSEQIEKPVQVRYAWANNPDLWNLRGSNGLPASPFETE
ncbi:MAG: sialate O-acetylesterase [Prevotellaceae bacterium]|jgi:sialate O-acetylesterase|nr:sialate O-acetylesterase [Prevotellaceae bacterium]